MISKPREKMKILSFTFILVFISVLAQAQIKAVTDTGDEVLLFDDGTWKYANKDSVSTEKKIPLNPQKFVKKASSSFLLKSKKMKIGVWLNPKKWSFEKATTNKEAEYEFKLKGNDLYCLMITERLSMPLTTLKFAVMENAKSVMRNFKLLKEEYRLVNGLKVYCIEMEGTYQGIKLNYYGYCYSNESGSTQLIAYTSKQLFKEYQGLATDLLNGLVEIK